MPAEYLQQIHEALEKHNEELARIHHKIRLLFAAFLVFAGFVVCAWIYFIVVHLR